MARIQMGVIVTDIRGKLAGNQFSKTRAGNILQRKCSQRKGATPAQSLKRSFFAEAARYWRTLTESERNQNNTNTSSYPVIDKFGNTTYLSGYQLLLRSNINLASIEEPPINVVPGTPPAGAGVFPLNVVIVVAGGAVTTANVEWIAPTGDYTTKRALIYISPGVSPGVAVYNGRFILAGYAGAGDLSFDFVNSYISEIPVPGSGDKVFCILDLMDEATGIVVNSYRISGIVNPGILSYEVTLTSGISWNFFIVFGNGSNIVPAGYEVQLSYSSGVTPLPPDPAVLLYTTQTVLNAGTSTNPHVESTSATSGSGHYVWWRLLLIKLTDGSVTSTDYSYVLYG